MGKPENIRHIVLENDFDIAAYRQPDDIDIGEMFKNTKHDNIMSVLGDGQLATLHLVGELNDFDLVVIIWAQIGMQNVAFFELRAQGKAPDPVFVSAYRFPHEIARNEQNIRALTSLFGAMILTDHTSFDSFAVYDPPATDIMHQFARNMLDCDPDSDS